RVKSLEGPVRSRSALRTPHFIVLGISEKSTLRQLCRISLDRKQIRVQSPHPPSSVYRNDRTGDKRAGVGGKPQNSASELSEITSCWEGLWLSRGGYGT